MKIQLKQLEKLFQLIIKQLKEDNVDFVDFNTDWYWEVCEEEIVNFDKEPKPIVGSLKEDLDILTRILEGSVPFSYMDLGRIATLLKIIQMKKGNTNFQT
ncbi:MAG: hypothetical protein AAF960_28020 [Bacteroidota bacterium]